MSTAEASSPCTTPHSCSVTRPANTALRKNARRLIQRWCTEIGSARYADALLMLWSTADEVESMYSAGRNIWTSHVWNMRRKLVCQIVAPPQYENVIMENGPGALCNRIIAVKPGRQNLDFAPCLGSNQTVLMRNGVYKCYWTWNCVRVMNMIPIPYRIICYVRAPYNAHCILHAVYCIPYTAYRTLHAACHTTTYTFSTMSILYYTVPCHAIPWHPVLCHALPCPTYRALPCSTLSCPALLCHAISYHNISYHITSHHTIPYHPIPYHTIPYHTIPYHTIP